ncbi:MAG: hypothetical protein OHK0022_35490 [Roseiflexaceae bacterium]
MQIIERYHQHAAKLGHTWPAGEQTALLARLAYWLHGHAPNMLASEAQIRAALHDGHSATEEQINAFLLGAHGQGGPLVEHTPGQYALRDRMLQEYYAAQHLIADRERGMRLIRLHLHEPRWDTPILLALALAGQTSPEAATELLETAVLAQGAQAERLGLEPSRHENLLGRDYLFAIRCLAEQIPIQPRLLRPLLERLADETLRRSGLAVYAYYRELLDAHLAALSGPAAEQLVPMLLSGLRGPAREVRLRAASALGRLGTSESIAALRVALEQGDPELRRAVVRALGTFGRPAGGAVAVLRGLLNRASPELRREVVSALERQGKAAETAEALRVALGDSANTVRLEAARVLAALGSADALVRAVLGEGLGSAHPSERFLALGALAGLGGEEEDVVVALRNALDDDNPTVRHEALKLLGNLRTSAEGVVAALRTASEHSDPATRIQALGVLGRLPGEGAGALAALQPWLAQDDWQLRREAVRALGKLRSEAPGAAAALSQALRDTDAQVRREAIRSLAQLASSDVVAALALLIEDPDPEVRGEVFRALGAQEATAVTPLLHSALGTTGPDVAYRAAGTLAALGETSDTIAALALEGLPNAADWQTRYQLAAYLGRAAQPEAPVLEALLAGLLDRDNTVRQACAAALTLLGQHFPAQVAAIEHLLLRTLGDPAFATLDRISKRNGHDYAHEALWRLMQGGRE